ncbi:MAG: hypothetical protein O7B98_03390, partial [Alphaproteobacteria bacterium]|nr:hypothetical protein [Alphaproteobacteria bacterium]
MKKSNRLKGPTAVSGETKSGLIEILREYSNADALAQYAKARKWRITARAVDGSFDEIVLSDLAGFLV